MLVAGFPCQLYSVGQMLQTWRHDAVMITMRSANICPSAFQGPLKVMIFLATLRESSLLSPFIPRFDEFQHFDIQGTSQKPHCVNSI